MKNPSLISRGLFVGSVGFLLVSVLFNITGIPAAQVFSTVGGLVSLVLYFFFVKNSQQKKRSDYARHATFITIVTAIVLKSFEVSAGSYLFLVALVAFLVWLTWSVLEQLPPAEKD
jgi:O-antigen/teichoic acid export membrane protein